MADDPLAFGLDLGLVRQRIQALGYFLTVEDAEAASIALEDENAIPPAAYLSIASETAEPNKMIGRHEQRITLVLSVLFAEGAAHADRDSRDRMDLTRKALVRQIIAWTPAPTLTPMQYRAYQFRAMQDGLLWGEVTFSTSYCLTI